MLDLTSLKKAVEALERSVAVSQAAGGYSDDVRETLRAGVIQNFEVGFELSWKFIQRWLRENRTPEEADHPRTRKELFRIAARAGLIEDPTPWFGYGDARNLTSHTYNAEEAEAVYVIALGFLFDAKALLKRLETYD